jgi:hypothetical protein
MLLLSPTVIHRWGGIGCQRPWAPSKDDEIWEEAKWQIRVILRRRESKGYWVVGGQLCR